MVEANPPADRRHDPLRYAAEMIERAERDGDDPTQEGQPEPQVDDAAAEAAETSEPDVVEAPAVGTAADFAEPEPGERISGIVRSRVNLNSGSFAIVENSREFTLVPWRPVLERQLGREVSGRVRSSGSISWTFGRERQGPEIGM